MSKETWSLDELYSSIHSKEFKDDFKQCKTDAQNLLSWAKSNLKSRENSLEKLEYYISFTNRFESVLNKLGEYCQLVLSTDSNNSEALKALEQAEDLFTELTPIDSLFTSWIASLPDLETLISGSPLLREHRFFLEETREKSKYVLSDGEELVLSKMKATGSLAWNKLWEVLSSTLLIEIDGQKHPLPAVRNMAYSHDRQVRKKAYEGEIQALGTIAQTSAAALNGIKGEVIQICRLRGYASPLDMTLADSRMERDVLQAMLGAMKEYLPYFREYLRAKAIKLGHKNGLPFYDLFAPMGSNEMTYTSEEAKAFVIEKFSSFSPDLGNYARRAFENRWIDWYPKEGKRGGAFCSNLHAIGESRILTNFSGSFNDVITLAHELGHGYHGHCLNHVSHINSDYPMPIAETASTFCETLVKNAALQNAGREEKLVILENDISDNTQIVVDILSRFLFEDSLFTERENGSLSVDELCGLMLKAQRETYGDGLDPDYLHQYMWVVKPHYYDGDYNYYNFPYAFGLLFAKGLYSIYQEKGSAFADDYVKLLGATGCHTHKEIAMMAGIDITDDAFWKKSLDVMKQDIQQYIALL